MAAASPASTQRATRAGGGPVAPSAFAGSDAVWRRVSVIRRCTASADTPGSDARVGIGGIDWHELLTTDPDAAWAFYSKVFKWEANGEMEMGEGGKYRMFKKAGGDHSLGGIMKAPPGMPGSG